MLRSSVASFVRLFQRKSNINCINFTQIAEYRSVYNVEDVYRSAKASQLSPDSDAKSTENSPKKTFDGVIPIEDLQISHFNSSAPGGMTGNKAMSDNIKSGVEVKFHVLSAKWIPESIKSQISKKEAGRITKDGFLVISSSKTRLQILNQADCLEKIRTIIWEADNEKQDDPEMLKLRLNEEKSKFLRIKKNEAFQNARKK